MNCSPTTTPAAATTPNSARTLPQAGTYYLGVSGGGNTSYNPLTGLGTPSQEGDYSISVETVAAPVVPTITIPTITIPTITIPTTTVPTIAVPTTTVPTTTMTVPTTVILPPPATLVGSRQYAVGSGKGGPAAVTLFNPDGGVARQFAPFDPGFGGGVRTVAADFTGDGVADVVVGTGPGGVTRVRVLDGATGEELFSVQPFEDAFHQGVFVAAGDLDGDGVPDLVITPDEGGGPRVRVFSGKGFAQIADFFGIEDTNFRGGGAVRRRRLERRRRRRPARLRRVRRRSARGGLQRPDRPRRRLPGEAVRRLLRLRGRPCATALTWPRET